MPRGGEAVSPTSPAAFRSRSRTTRCRRFTAMVVYPMCGLRSAPTNPSHLASRPRSKERSPSCPTAQRTRKPTRSTPLSPVAAKALGSPRAGGITPDPNRGAQRIWPAVTLGLVDPAPVLPGETCSELTPPAQCGSSSEVADALPSWHGHHRLPELWSAQPRPPDRFRVPSLPQMQVRASLACRC
jgi:hypothetical protein